MRQDLERAYSAEPGRLEIIELSGLTREDSRQLLALLLRDAPPSAQALRDHSDRLWHLTSGLPVQVALIVELIAHGEHLDSTVTDEAENVETWGRRLVGALFRYDDPAGRVLFFLALARKGATAELLHYLEPGWPRPECEHRLAQVRGSSVVKTRPGREEVFLHDALYELFDAYPPPDTQLRPWYERLADYYRAQQAQAGNNRAAWGQATVSLLYYELQRDPRQAFEAGYVRWNELAIKGHEVGLDMQLRDELLRFFRLPANRQRAAAQGLTQEAIDRDSAVRWVKRFLAWARHQQATTVAETILALGPMPYPTFVPDRVSCLADLPAKQQAEARAIFGQADPLFWGHLLTYYGEALVYTGAPEAQARHVLDQAITLLRSVSLARREPLTWLRERVLGRAHNTLGYLLRNYGHYAGALESYRHALLHFEAAGIVDEQADTLNNLAFLLALLGDAEEARDHANQALILRQRLGQRYPLALSHNARGRVYALQGQAEWGRRECQLALGIFEELEAPRGIGLACNALGFILRQQGEAWKAGQCSPDEAAEFFQEAAGFLERAAHIFSEQVTEPIRLWEAHNEQGSLCCDWGYLLRQQRDEPAAQQRYHEAVRHHLQALEVAQRHGLHFQEADTCDDLAQVWADQGNMDKACQWLEQALSLVPAEFALAAGKGFQEAPEPGVAYWLILGKAHLQQGIWTLQFIEQNTLTEKRRQEHVREGIEHLAMAAAYFQRYWSGTPMLSTRLRSIAHYLGKAGVSAEEAKALVSQVVHHYQVGLSALLNVVGANLDQTPDHL